MGRKPKCKICGLEIDKETQHWYKNSVGYYHIECRRKKGLPVDEYDKTNAPESVKIEVKNMGNEVEAKTVKCYFCGLPIDKDKAVRQEGKIFHKDCHSEYLDRRELFRYCCSLWGLKAPGPLISRQAKKFRQKGYTYRGMMFSLKYFYEVKNNNKNKYKGSETIGIIPYIYEEAKQHYTNILQQKEELAKNAAAVTTQEIKVVKVKQIKKKPDLFEFEDL